MKKLCLLFLLFAAPIEAAHVVIVSGGSGADSVDAATTTAADTTGATFLVAGCSFFGEGGARSATLTDSNSNTWTALTEMNDSGGPAVLIWYVNSATPTVGAGHTFTCTSVDGFPVVGFLAASGGRATPFDQQNVDSGGGSSVPDIDHNGGIDPTEDNTLIFSVVSNFRTSLSIGSGFTAFFTQNFSSGVTMAGGFAYFLQSGAANSNPTWTWSTSSAAASAIANFKSAAAPPASGPCTISTTGAGRC